jgi:hypothetical protein
MKLSFVSQLAANCSQLAAFPYAQHISFHPTLFCFSPFFGVAGICTLDAF